eukprot:CAMPEP_0201251898 /NCGR_PEP_ID=MMETSP0852-20130820/66616_1 /ASSEMBLY_ACC=CAM_ASM_000632 /TAXON_ID=183588 /ORGANISM="Pseudo-nitzschia fraudulenta, Strain WWA7" /LENGTH=164 /DNA_ID=CAMNT_0047551551 /DNA_START=496 /DNA_END=987 /DNA_ORIENTATION=-
MVKKKSGMARRRKKSSTNTTTNEGAKCSKTEEKNPAQYRDGILQGINALLGKMDDKKLVAVMAYVSTMEEKQKSTTALQPSMTVTTTATEDATATVTVTATVNAAAEAANFTTTEGNPSGAQTTTPESANPTTTATVPPSPEDQPVIQLNKHTSVSPHNIVTID